MDRPKTRSAIEVPPRPELMGRMIRKASSATPGQFAFDVSEVGFSDHRFLRQEAEHVPCARLRETLVRRPRLSPRVSRQGAKVAKRFRRPGKLEAVTGRNQAGKRPLAGILWRCSRERDCHREGSAKAWRPPRLQCCPADTEKGARLALLFLVCK